ncbi:response regulator transcription factor [Pseudomonas sp. CAN2814]|uniref:response regulator transcription factor n=1 Tax=Pseudomonas sp. CAN1 TaxID=3046726 RepID=UPI002649C444|nr:response regulator transcription factor [Pseudomonas sp. CAN1]MDN6859975.1 response regulator transcription factor [Pseudomonas sp. CAN1]
MLSENALPNVIVADPQPMIGWGLERYLAENQLARVKAFVSDTDSLLEALSSQPDIDLIVIELALPGARGRDGVHLVEWIQRHHPDVRILVYSIMGAPLLASAVVKCGAVGYVCKRNPLHLLDEAFARIRKGEIYIDPMLRPPRHSGKPLSPTEIDIIRRLAHGATVGEIAERTNRSVSTISTHKRNAMMKLGINNDAQLVVAGLLDWLGEL